MMTTRRKTLALLMVIGAPALSLVAQSTTGSPDAASHASGQGVAGKWHFVLQTDGGPRSSEADFQQDGKNVTGTWDKKAAVKGMFADGKLELEFPIQSDEAGEGSLRISGRLTDALTGSWSFQSYSGTFKATRADS